MKMENISLEFISFDAQDVIATSGRVYAPGHYIKSWTNDGNLGFAGNPQYQMLLWNEYYTFDQEHYYLCDGTIVEDPIEDEDIPGLIVLSTTQNVGTEKPSGEGVYVLENCQDIIDWLVNGQHQ